MLLVLFWACIKFDQADLCRFSKAEKEALKAAAIEFAREKGLGEDNFDWLFSSRTGEQRELTAGAWKAIANNGLPHRSVRSVWACGTRILHPSHYKVTPSASGAGVILAFISIRREDSATGNC